MKEYHKIQTVFLRNPENNHKTLLEGAYSRPEFEYLAGNPWVFTEKVDGTNIRVMRDGDTISFGGKTDAAQIPAVLFQRLTDLFLPIERRQLLAEVFADSPQVCLYGEGYGGKIQKGGGRYGVEQRFVLFDVKIGDWWLQRKDVEDIAGKLSLDVVPIIGEGTLPEMVEMARAGIKSRWGDFEAEGIVARPETELIARNGQRLITKIKTRDFA